MAASREAPRLAWRAPLLLAALLPLACAPDPSDTVPIDPARLQPAVERAVRRLRSDQPVPPAALLNMDPLYRWFGVEEFAGLRKLYDRNLATLQRRAASIPTDSDLHPAFLRVHRRLIAPHAIDTEGRESWEEFAPGMLARGGLSAIGVPALYCDVLGLPRDYAATLRRSVENGGYELTHVAQALGWLRENGCESPLGPDFEARVAEIMARIPGRDARVTDLELEATAFLFYLKRPDLVRVDFVEVALAAQREDGGWSEDSADPALESNWHSTVFALWTLLELREPGLATGRWLPTR